MPEDRAAGPTPASGGGAPASSALSIEALYADAVGLSPRDFEARYGSGFLLLSAAGAEERGGSTTTRLWLDDGDPAANANTANIAVVAYPLRPRGASAGHLVTIGREARHDVAISDLSVSRFHAIARRDGEGTFLLQDQGSTNGTTVNGAPVLARGAGPPTAIKPGDTVKIGQVEFTFTDARALQEFAREAGG